MNLHLNEYNNHRDDFGNSIEWDELKADNRPYDKKRIGNCKLASRSGVPTECNLLLREILLKFPN